MGEQSQVEVQNKAIIQRYWDGKWNQRRPEILDELQTPDVVYHGTSMSMNGLEEYKQVYAVFAAAFQDTRLEIQDLIAEGDKVSWERAVRVAFADRLNIPGHRYRVV